MHQRSPKDRSSAGCGCDTRHDLDPNIRIILSDFTDQARHTVDSRISAAHHCHILPFLRLCKCHAASISLFAHRCAQKCLIRKFFSDKVNVYCISDDHRTFLQHLSRPYRHLVSRPRAQTCHIYFTHCPCTPFLCLILTVISRSAPVRTLRGILS